MFVEDHPSKGSRILEELKKIEIKTNEEWGVYKAVFSHADPNKRAEDLLLTIDKVGPRILEITLSNVRWNTPVVSGFWSWLEVDWGKFVWNEKYQDYKLKKGLPKTFYCLKDYYNGRDVRICFDFLDHLVQKDKDEQKNYMWYQFDYNQEIGEYLYDLLNPYLDRSKTVYAIPGEQGQVLDAWGGHNEDLEAWQGGVDMRYHATDWPENKYNSKYDLSKHSRKTFLEIEVFPPALVISFLPTSSENWKLPMKQRMTGTKFFKELWEIFIKHGDPVVIKCYSDFIRQMSMKHPDWFAKLDKTVELPLQIGGKAMGTSNTLAFFNCPWIKNKTKKELDFDDWQGKKFADGGDWSNYIEDSKEMRVKALERLEKENKS